jgi:hypothetical protein
LSVSKPYAATKTHDCTAFGGGKVMFTGAHDETSSHLQISVYCLKFNSPCYPQHLGFLIFWGRFFFNAPAVRRPAVCAARPHLSMEPLATKPWVMAPQCATARLGRNTPLAPWCRVERWWGPQHGSRDITRPQNLVCEHWITNNSYYIYSMCIYIYVCVYIYVIPIS